MDELAYWIGFNHVSGVGPARLRALLDYFGDIRSAWEAPPGELSAIGLDRRSIENLVTVRRRLDLAVELEKVRCQGVQVLTWNSPAYPRYLLHIDNAPPVLYVRGTLVPEDQWAVAIVGTRRASPYGREAARQLATDLARQGVTIVSGLARGVDAVAHEATLEAGGRTLAVLGSGVDVIYPAEHRRLARRIVEAGAIISEYALGTRPEARNFPPRNRILSGLSRGVIVVEAGERSGALITARFAAEQGKEVFAVPGSIFQKGSSGTNRLIQEGATPITSAADVLIALDIGNVKVKGHVRAVLPANPTEAQVLDALSAEPRHVDEVSRSCNMPMAEVSSALALMELKGMVRHVGGMHYVRVGEG